MRVAVDSNLPWKRRRSNPTREPSVYNLANFSICRDFKAHAGFEPVSGEEAVPEPLRRKLDELRARNRKRVRRGDE